MIGAPAVLLATGRIFNRNDFSCINLQMFKLDFVFNVELCLKV